MLTEYEINLSACVDVIKESLIKILLSSLILLTPLILYAIFSPKVYSSSIIVAPVDEVQGGGLSAISSQLGSIASLTGLSLGSQSNEIQLAIETMKSKKFISSVVDKYKLKPFVMAAKNFSYETGIAYDSSVFNDADLTWKRDVDFPLSPEPNDVEVWEEFLKLFKIENDEDAGLVKITFNTISPYFSEKLPQIFIDEINDYMRKEKVAEAKQSIVYLSEQLEKTDVPEMEKVFYQLIEEQMKNSMLAEVRKEYVFKIIDPSYEPYKYNLKSKIILVVVGLLFSFFLVTFYFLFINRSKLILNK